ncbi:hypothetical protein HanXRQr2_Chr17g0818001 [Helianthus annuus]|uniref:Uncharacterized protein n=1 Tax=Helianthus annuus TaxID=4232 RepID=A0A9K3DKF6_HELAN|nr:hypothetical protein HanXRQr2_Chr17g0818001 [Helianthus annuus]KAJ0814420.1 hypothetical protein HanPSC8_Chr17g0785531 [Helianthus annuus]
MDQIVWVGKNANESDTDRIVSWIRVCRDEIDVNRLIGGLKTKIEGELGFEFGV